MTEQCLTEPVNISLHITEEMDGLLENRSRNVEDEIENSPSDTTDGEVEELSTASSVGQSTPQLDQQTDDSRFIDVVTPPLPEGCKPLSHQVAGHIHGKGKTKAGKKQTK